MFVDANNFDYQYLDSSPCIDSGNPNLLDPDNTISDIGANFYNQSEECGLPGDINDDSLVNVLDVVEVANFILSANNDYVDCLDINTDGFINVVDIISIVNIILNF